jgi:hypothetical protein
MKQWIRWSLIAHLSFGGIIHSRADGGSTGVGNGGDGLQLNGKVYVLDLVESGAEESPFFDPRFQAREQFTIRLQRTLGHLPDLNIQKLSRKLNELARVVSPFFARMLLQTIEKFNWVVVSQTLVDIPDEDSVLDYPAGMLIQLAVRRDTVIRIGRLAWSNLNEDHKIALITHEAIYAITPVQLTSNQIEFQPSSRARDINGMIYTQYDSNSLNAMMENYRFPHHSGVYEVNGGLARVHDQTWSLESDVRELCIELKKENRTRGLYFWLSGISLRWQALNSNRLALLPIEGTIWQNFPATAEEWAVMKEQPLEQCIQVVRPRLESAMRDYFLNAEIITNNITNLGS